MRRAPGRFPPRDWVIALAAAVVVAAAFRAWCAPGDSESGAEETGPAAAETDAAADSAPAYVTEAIRGQVTWLADALEERYGIKVDADVALAVVALETTEGELLPIVKDARGRAFHLDERLRGIDVELLLRRYEGSPVAQVVRVYTLRDGQKFEFDYYCDVCAIVMHELKECECCQGPIRIRERRVSEE
jgi:hypothetical protein